MWSSKLAIVAGLVAPITAIPLDGRSQDVCSSGIYGELSPLKGYPVAVAFCQAVFPPSCVSSIPRHKRAASTTRVVPSTTPRISTTTAAPALVKGSSTTASRSSTTSKDPYASMWTKCRNQPYNIISTLCSCIQSHKPCKTTAITTSKTTTTTIPKITTPSTTPMTTLITTPTTTPVTTPITTPDTTPMTTPVTTPATTPMTTPNTTPSATTTTTTAPGPTVTSCTQAENNQCPDCSCSITTSGQAICSTYVGCSATQDLCSTDAECVAIYGSGTACVYDDNKFCGNRKICVTRQNTGSCGGDLRLTARRALEKVFRDARRAQRAPV